MYFSLKSYIFWDITRVACWKSTEVSEEHVTSIFRIEEYAKEENNMKQAASSTLVSCLAYSSSLKMEVTCSSEMSVDFQQTTMRPVRDGALHNHRCEVLHLSYDLSINTGGWLARPVTASPESIHRSFRYSCVTSASWWWCQPYTLRLKQWKWERGCQGQTEPMGCCGSSEHWEYPGLAKQDLLSTEFPKWICRFMLCSKFWQSL
jgi:hypothetical protein